MRNANPDLLEGVLKNKLVMSGNEAVARGAFESGVRFASGYPGTPSTEILEAIVQYPSIHAEWAPNEKVALEAAAGASLAGSRSLVTMKHVGLNVAADPFFSLAYSGVNAGLVVVSADDPGMHSSQNEQDNRHLARAAKVPMLEPSDSQEAKEFTRTAFAISEQYDTPVVLRLTTRISHSEGIVKLDEPVDTKRRRYSKDFRKNVLLPSNARGRHEFVERRMRELEESAVADNSLFHLNRIEFASREMGIITSGAAYQYAREVFPTASFLKLGLTNPLPKKLIRYFASQVKRLIVVEELDPYLEEQLRAMGLSVAGKEYIPTTGELNPDIVARAFGDAGVLADSGNRSMSVEISLPARPPTLCPGCSHRGVFMVLKKLRATVTGDIGCYTLGALPPLEAMDTCLDMGASIGIAYGMERVMEPADRKNVVAVIGDSTFIHSGITSLINIVYNKGTTTVCILDNHTTAMTGHQPHPATGRTLKGEAAPKLDFEQLARAIGVHRVRKINPFDLEETEKVFREEMGVDEPSVIIADAPCILHEKIDFGGPYEIIEEECPKCGLCVKVGCPAIGVKENGMPYIDPLLCPGCGLCAKVCKFDAIVPVS